MTKRTLLCLLVLVGTMFSAQAAQAQGTASASASTPKPDSIHTWADFMPIPMMRVCDKDSLWQIDSIRTCALYELNTLIANQMRYPHQAIRDSIQGRVVVSFVVDTFGVIRDLQIVQDIGAGCGAEAVRIFRDMTSAGLRWVPAMHNEERVALRMMWPIKFKIKPYIAPISYVNSSGITVYTENETQPSYTTGEEALLQYVTDKLPYPVTEKAGCKTGVMEFSLIIMPNNTVEIEHMVDFSNLGLDFQFEAIKMLNNTRGQWTPATYQGKPVAALYPLRVLFKSDAPACKQANDRFDQSIMLHAEGLAAYDLENHDLVIEKYTKALALTPNNTEFLYIRGSSYAAKGNKEEACKDYTAIKTLLGKVWFQNIFTLLCGG